MSVARRALTVVLLASVSGCITARPPDDTHSRPDFEGRLNALKTQGFSGQVLMAHRGHIVVDRAFGHADPAGLVAVSRETGFGIASVTKSFTAAAILKLCQAGRLRLDSKLGTLLSNVPPDKRDISLEQLLSHRSGLGTTYAADGETNRVVAARKLLAQPLHFPPGSDFKYSDDGYVLLAIIIEEKSGRSYEEFLSSEIFRPARMTHTYFWGTRDLRDFHQLAAMNRDLDPKLTAPQWGQRGSGGVISTAEDLYRWWQALRGGKILSAAAVDDLLRPRTALESGIRVGLGWFSSMTHDQTVSFWARGNEDFGYNAILVAYPAEGYVIAVTSNAFEGDQPWSRLVKTNLEALITAETKLLCRPGI